MSDIFKDFLKSNGIAYSENVNMSSMTTFKVGGAADIVVYPSCTDEVVACVKMLGRIGEKYHILGNGSNVLVSDDGIRGVVIKTEKMNEISLDGTVLTVGAGCTNAKAAVFAAEHSLSGMEFAHGIPGSIGGAVRMNAGAYDGMFADIVSETEYVDAEGNVKTVKGEDHLFGYRRSCFREFDIICKTRLVLSVSDKDKIKDRMKELIEKRRASQPLEYPSAGSFFKRPEGYFAGKLIQDCGLKGFRIGGAQVSEKHSGFIINVGGATCKDIDELSAYVRKTVFEKFGVELEPEVRRL